MSYRDESDALRARIATLEAKLSEKGAGEELQVANVAGPSLLARRVSRYALTLEGHVSSEGLEAMGQLLWAQVGGADHAVGEDHGPPGRTVLTHARGKRVFRVLESSGKTHITVDDHHWGVAQSFGAIVVVSAVLGLSMLAAGVHDDWIQMFMAIYAIAVVLLGPLAYFVGRDQESKSVAALKNAVEVAKEHIVLGRERIRVDPASVNDISEHAEEERLSSQQPRVPSEH